MEGGRSYGSVGNLVSVIRHGSRDVVLGVSYSDIDFGYVVELEAAYRGIFGNWGLCEPHD